jgi:predicted RNA-binding Zn ribbon-like protein
LDNSFDIPKEIITKAKFDASKSKSHKRTVTLPKFNRKKPSNIHTSTKESISPRSSMDQPAKVQNPMAINVMSNNL